jgi:hypothetical protein
MMERIHENDGCCSLGKHQTKKACKKDTNSSCCWERIVYDFETTQNDIDFASKRHNQYRRDYKIYEICYYSPKTVQTKNQEVKQKAIIMAFHYDHQERKEHFMQKHARVTKYAKNYLHQKKHLSHVTIALLDKLDKNEATLKTVEFESISFLPILGSVQKDGEKYINEDTEVVTHRKANFDRLQQELKQFKKRQKLLGRLSMVLQ